MFQVCRCQGLGKVTGTSLSLNYYHSLLGIQVFALKPSLLKITGVGIVEHRHQFLL